MDQIFFRLLELVKTAFEYPQFYVLNKSKKDPIYLCKPQFYHMHSKWVQKGCESHGRVRVMWTYAC